MKRHTALAPLSREHHGGLILAQLLKKGAPVYQGLPSDIDGKANYAIQFYQDELIKHFEAEEKVIKKINGINIELDKLAAVIIGEHVELRTLFTSMKNAPDLPKHLDQLGRALEQHIRREEREFFPMIQEVCSDELLSQIEQALSE